MVIFTNVLTVLQAIQSSSKKEANPLNASLQFLISTVHKAVLQWVPAYCGIRGNERVDKLAKDGALKHQVQSRVTFHEVKNIIKAQSRK